MVKNSLIMKEVHKFFISEFFLLFFSKLLEFSLRYHMCRCSTEEKFSFRVVSILNTCVNFGKATNGSIFLGFFQL